MIHGCTPATFFILPMLGRHPKEYPRFRDCFTEDEEHPEYNDHIHVYTRVGGGNRESGYGEEILYKDENFVATFDDSFDNTFASYVFSVPEKWKDDYEKIKNGKLTEISSEYKDQLYKVFSKLKDQLDEIFNAKANNTKS